MKKLRAMGIILLLILAVAGCAKKDETVKKDAIEEVEQPKQEDPEEIPEVSEDELHDGKIKSNLTGEWIDGKYKNKRPVAIMINNIKYASPQDGTSQASIMYEALAEGGITRMMGIFEDFDAKRIGSVRSARHYFVSFASEYDAIFAHFGQTKYAAEKIKKLGVDNLSGLSAIGTTVYYRDNAVKAPHNAFASKEGIEKGIEKLKYRTEHKEGFEPQHFGFYKEDTVPADGAGANKVSLGYSSYAKPYFDYHPDDKLYYRSQFDKPHVDKTTGKQLAFKNIIIQLVKESNIDHNGYQTMELDNASGSGYYITGGKAVEITWKKNEGTGQMHYYDKNGTILTINPGRTFISVYPNNRTSSLNITE